MPSLSAEQIDHQYRYWRMHLMFAMVIGYGAFYLTRKSMLWVMPVMQHDLGLDNNDIGLLGTLFYLTYGLSKWLSGLLCDHFRSRWFMGVGLMITGVLNVVFAFCHHYPALLAVWLLNGFFQGWGWPPCARLLTSWYSRNERGRWWGGWNMSITLSGAAVPLICALLASHFGWQSALLLPGAVAVVTGLWLCRQLQDNPQQLGLPSVGHWRRDPFELRQEQQSPPMPITRIFSQYILRNRTLWLLALSYVLVYLIRTALNDWGNLWLAQSHGVTLLGANATLSLFELGGLFGSLFAGWGADLIFGGQRAPMILLFAIGLFVAVTALCLAPLHHYPLLAVCFFTTGFFVFGPQMLIGLAATEYTHKDAAGTVTGFLGLFAYLGAALAGWPLARLMASFGWPGFFTLLAVTAALIGLLLMPLLMAGLRPPPPRTAQ